jgi:hypothetical protein
MLQHCNSCLVRDASLLANMSFGLQGLEGPASANASLNLLAGLCGCYGFRDINKAAPVVHFPRYL